MTRPFRKGLFISFEGGEGLGKSTQIALLVKFLKRRRFSVLVTREPGGTKIGEKLRDLFKSEKMDPLTELFIVEAVRAEHVSTIILPALRKGKIVISDRFFHSTFVYQGFVGGLDRRLIAQLNQIATQGLAPRRVYLLDGATRWLKGRSKKDKFDQASNRVHSTIRKGYLQLAKKDKTIRRFEANQDRLTLHRQIVKDLEPLLKYVR